MWIVYRVMFDRRSPRTLLRPADSSVRSIGQPSWPASRSPADLAAARNWPDPEPVVFDFSDWDL